MIYRQAYRGLHRQSLLSTPSNFAIIIVNMAVLSCSIATIVSITFTLEHCEVCLQAGCRGCSPAGTSCQLPSASPLHTASTSPRFLTFPAYRFYNFCSAPKHFNSSHLCVISQSTKSSEQHNAFASPSLSLTPLFSKPRSSSPRTNFLLTKLSQPGEDKMPRSGYDTSGLAPGSQGAQAAAARAKQKLKGAATPRAGTPSGQTTEQQKQDPEVTPKASSQVRFGGDQSCIDPRLLDLSRSQPGHGHAPQPPRQFAHPPSFPQNLHPNNMSRDPFHQGVFGTPPNTQFFTPSNPFTSQDPTSAANANQSGTLHGYDLGASGRNQTFQVNAAGAPAARQKASDNDEGFIHHSNVSASDHRYAAFNPDDNPAIREEDESFGATRPGPGFSGRQ